MKTRRVKRVRRWRVTQTGITLRKRWSEQFVMARTPAEAESKARRNPKGWRVQMDSTGPEVVGYGAIPADGASDR